MKKKFVLTDNTEKTKGVYGVFPSFYFNSNMKLKEIQSLKNYFPRVVNNFLHRDELYLNAEDLSLLYVNNFKEDFETYSKRRHSLRFYAIILKSYYFPLIIFSLSKYIYLKKFLKKNYKEDMFIEIYSDNSFKGFQSKDDFIFNLYANTNFQGWISSVILQRLSVKKIKLKVRDETFPLNTLNPESNFQRNFRKRFFSKDNLLKPHRFLFLFFELLVEKIGYKHMLFQHIYGIGPLNSIFFSILLKLRSYFKYKNIQSKELSFNPNAKDNFEKEFIEIIEYIIQRTLPYSKEKFETILSSLDLKKETWRANNSRFDSTGIYNEKKAFKHALSFDQGEKLVFVQHGSHYETYAHSLSADSYEYLGDYFIKWGKAPPKKNTQCKFIHLPSPKLSRLSNKHCPINNNIIFVSSSWKFLLDGIAWVDPANMFHYLEEKLKLIQELNDTKLGNFYFRPWLNMDYEQFDELAFFKNFTPDLKVLTSCLSKEMLSCKLLLLDHYGTSLYEAMVANVPLIGYFGYPEQTFTPEAERVIGLLKKAKIFHDDSEGVIKTLNYVGDNIDTWWQSSECQIARQEFMDAFASTDKHWRLKWMKFLAGISKEENFNVL